ALLTISIDCPRASENNCMPRSTSFGHSRQMTTHPKLSVVVPCYNEAECLNEFHKRMTAACIAASMSSYEIFVNDGSTGTSKSLIWPATMVIRSRSLLGFPTRGVVAFWQSMLTFGILQSCCQR